MKYLSIVLVLLCSVIVSAQTTPCTTTINELNSYKGLRLGMTQVEVENVVGGILEMETVLSKPFRYTSDNDDIKNIEVDIGERSSKFYITKDNRNENLKGISSIEFEFYNDYLYVIKINSYPKTQPWNSIKDFTNKLSEELNLPASAWQGQWVTKPVQFSILRCDGLGGTATLQFSPKDIWVGFTIADFKKSKETTKAAEEAGEKIRREKEATKP